VIELQACDFALQLGFFEIQTGAGELWDEGQCSCDATGLDGPMMCRFCIELEEQGTNEGGVEGHGGT
jgi:hypothetical protein